MHANGLADAPASNLCRQSLNPKRAASCGLSSILVLSFEGFSADSSAWTPAKNPNSHIAI